MAKWTDEPCFYVSVVDGGRVGLVAGPFKTHEEAQGMVETARKKACELDPWADFYAFGTVKTVNGWRRGVINDHLGVIIDDQATEAKPA
jgi:hypothetical protein